MCYDIMYFALMDLPDKIIEMEFSHSHLQDSTPVSFQDLQIFKAKIVAQAPSESHKCLAGILCFINLLWMLFKSACSLFIKCIRIIVAIHKYPPDLIGTLPLHQKVFIYYILHPEARHFV
mmetsp:Transcript_26220/g.60278  ORF Transcript_26220/g.60278 Transcript_26220/m.60278 type:complete len:120 (+) Transcript_26220:2654-3013(+)